MSRLRLAVVLAVAMVMLVPSAALAGNHTADHLADHGYTCFNAGPISTNWMHCIKDQHLASGGPAVPVKVFSEDGSEFLGTELLLRAADIYNGQPCPQDGLETWEGPAGPGDAYVACHHFHTGHH